MGPRGSGMGPGGSEVGPGRSEVGPGGSEVGLETDRLRLGDSEKIALYGITGNRPLRGRCPIDCC